MKTLIQSDTLASIYRDANGDVTAHGKRVPADHPFTAEERRVYVTVKGNAVAMCKCLMDVRSITLKEAWTLVQLARGMNMQEMRRHRDRLRRMAAHAP